MSLRDGRNVVVLIVCVLTGGVVQAPVQRALLEESLESHKRLTTGKKRQVKEAGSMSIIRAIASHSMITRWKRNSWPTLC